MYKYLGLVINEFLDFNVTAKMVAKSTSRALSLVIGKCKGFGSKLYECYTKLFNAIIQPRIDYVWLFHLGHRVL